MNLTEFIEKHHFMGDKNAAVVDLKQLLNDSFDAAITYWLTDSTLEADLAFEEYFKTIQ